MQTIRQTIAKRRKERGKEDAEAGFTLIELLVVLLIIAILMLIAIPTFLSARTGAQNSAAQQTERNALTTAQSLYTPQGAYASSLPNGQGFTWGTAPSSHANDVAYSTGAAGQSIILADHSASGACYFIAEVMSDTSSLLSTTGSSSTTANTSGIDGVGTWYSMDPAPNSSCSAALGATGGPPATSSANWTSTTKGTAGTGGWAS